MRNPRLGLMFTVLGLSLPSPHAQPLLLMDTTFAHGIGAEARPNAVLPLPERIPADWKAPVDYSAGTVHFRLEVLAKPTETAIQYQPCLNQTSQPAGRQACARAETLTVAGLRTWSQPLAQWTSPLDWSARPHALALILKDAYGVPVVPGATNWVGDPYLSLYYPMTLRISAAVTSGGSAFPGWDGLIPVTARIPQGRTGMPASFSWSPSSGGRLLEIRYSAAGPSAAGIRIWDSRGRLLRTETWQASAGPGQVRRLELARAGEGGFRSAPLLLEFRAGGRSWKKILGPAP